MSRALRLVAATTATVGVLLFTLGLVVVGTGRRLEDACATEPPAEWAPELTVVRGPLVDGPTTFRCVKEGSPEDPFVFTDTVPLIMGVVVAVAALSVLFVVWMWAMRKVARASSACKTGTRAELAPGREVPYPACEKTAPKETRCRGSC